jgi:chromosome segregation ATPase
MDDSPRDPSDWGKRLEDAIARQQAQLDAFIEETENKLSELESSIEEVRGLAEQQAEIPDGIEERLEELESSKMDVPTEMELRNREYEVKFKKQLAEEQQEQQEELAKNLSLLDERIESLEEVDKQEGDNKDQMKEMSDKLADLEEKLSLLQEQLRARLK